MATTEVAGGAGRWREPGVTALVRPGAGANPVRPITLPTEIQRLIQRLIRWLNKRLIPLRSSR